MRFRCLNPRSREYKNYGARGIRVCSRWDSFANFLSDMGERPRGLTLDRIDNNGNYEPRNCRWANYATQNRNYRRNRMIEFNGRAMCLQDWAEEIGITWTALDYRIKTWPLDRALTQTPRPYPRLGALPERWPFPIST